MYICQQGCIDDLEIRAYYYNRPTCSRPIYRYLKLRSYFAWFIFYSRYVNHTEMVYFVIKFSIWQWQCAMICSVIACSISDIYIFNDKCIFLMMVKPNISGASTICEPFAKSVGFSNLFLKYTRRQFLLSSFQLLLLHHVQYIGLRVCSFCLTFFMVYSPRHFRLVSQKYTHQGNQKFRYSF